MALMMLMTNDAALSGYTLLSQQKNSTMQTNFTQYPDASIP
jgi:hypothetical protein